MQVYLFVFLASTISGIFWVVNAEAFAIAAGVTHDPRFNGPGLSLLLGCGQTVGFAVCYLFGERLKAWSKRLRAAVEKIPEEKFRKAAVPSLIVCCISGLPPVAAVAIVSGGLRVGFVRFCVTVAASRSVRYMILYYFGHVIFSALGFEVPTALPF